MTNQCQYGGCTNRALNGKACDFHEGKLPIKPDPVNNPSHYTSGGIECIDYLEAKLTPAEFLGFCKGNAIKYNSRANEKGATLQDYEKAQWYQNKLVETKRKHIIQEEEDARQKQV